MRGPVSPFSSHRRADRSSRVIAALTDGPATLNAKPLRQRRLAGELAFSGVGLFSGADVSVRLVPADPNHGLVFVRVDLPDSPAIPALVRNRVPEPRRTVLQVDAARAEMT